MTFEEPLGGIALFAGYTVWPLIALLDDAMTADEAKDACSCLSSSMNFFVWHGDADTTYPVEEAFEKYDSLFSKL